MTSETDGSFNISVVIVYLDFGARTRRLGVGPPQHLQLVALRQLPTGYNGLAEEKVLKIEEGKSFHLQALQMKSCWQQHLRRDTRLVNLALEVFTQPRHQPLMLQFLALFPSRGLD